MVGAALVIGIAWWFFYLSGRFEGPVVEIVDDDLPVLVSGVPHTRTESYQYTSEKDMKHVI